MTTNVTFEIAKLLKEKGFNIIGDNFYTPDTKTLMNSIWFDDEKVYKHGEISAPTIAEVLVWLYEKYGIWITIQPDMIDRPKVLTWMSTIHPNDYNKFAHDGYKECYLSSIEYILKNLI